MPKTLKVSCPTPQATGCWHLPWLAEDLGYICVQGVPAFIDLPAVADCRMQLASHVTVQPRCKVICTAFPVRFTSANTISSWSLSCQIIPTHSRRNFTDKLVVRLHDQESGLFRSVTSSANKPELLWQATWTCEFLTRPSSGLFVCCVLMDRKINELGTALDITSWYKIFYRFCWPGFLDTSFGLEY